MGWFVAEWQAECRTQHDDRAQHDRHRQRAYQHGQHLYADEAGPS